MSDLLDLQSPVRDGCESPCGCWEMNLGPLKEKNLLPLKEQEVLLTTEPLLQPVDLSHILCFLSISEWMNKMVNNEGGGAWSLQGGRGGQGR